jgi:hypothetical protein
MASPNVRDFSNSAPLTETNYRALNRALDRVAKAWLELERAERSGTDMSEQRRLLEFYQDQIDKKKKEYFKGKP